MKIVNEVTKRETNISVDVIFAHLKDALPYNREIGSENVPYIISWLPCITEIKVDNHQIIISFLNGEVIDFYNTGIEDTMRWFTSEDSPWN